MAHVRFYVRNTTNRMFKTILGEIITQIYQQYGILKQILKIYKKIN